MGIFNDRYLETIANDPGIVKQSKSVFLTIKTGAPRRIPGG
jgi:hypothetical protein